MRNRVFRLGIILGAALIGLSACENGAQFGAREKGALTGGALGAGLGAIVGNQVGNPGVGLAIGSAFGALAGGVAGQSIDEQSSELESRKSKLSEQERQLAENRRLIDELKASGADVRSTERGVVVNLPDVLFAFNRSDLTPQARKIARDVSTVLRDASNRRVSVEGHTDSVGTSDYNQRLSEARARSVSDELVHDGISRSRLSVRGFGEGRPIATNSTDSGRQRNRRVEVIIENDRR